MPGDSGGAFSPSGMHPVISSFGGIVEETKRMYKWYDVYKGTMYKGIIMKNILFQLILLEIVNFLVFSGVHCLQQKLQVQDNQQLQQHQKHER